MKLTVRIFIFFVLAVVVLAAVVLLYYLPMPKPPEEIDYKETVRQIRFSQGDTLKEWDEKRLSKKSTVYTIEENDGIGVLRAVSEGSASGLYLKEKLSYRDRPYVKWRWKVVEFPKRDKEESLDSKVEFDFAAQFYVLFHSRSIMKTRAIQYVWTETLPQGTSVRSPYTNNVRILVLESGGQGEWKIEERDISADYLELFGEKLDKDVAAIAFMTDSDSTETRAESFLEYVEIGYLPKEVPEESELEQGNTKQGGGH